MKEYINASELALLLGVSKQEAAGKIWICLNSNEVKVANEKNPEILVDRFEKRHKINLKPYLEDCWNNYMKRPASRGYVLNYPYEKIWHGKDKPYPKKVSLPAALRGLISPDVLEEIRLAWEEKYRHRLPSIIRDSLILKP